MILKKNKQLNASGFTLVEVMASVAILSIGLVGCLTAINYNLRNISSGEKKIAATSLAAEGIELARNVRDTNWLAGNNWDLNIEGANPSSETIKFFCGNADNNQQVPSSPDTLAACGANCRVYVYTKDGSGERCYSDDFGNQPGYNNTSPIATNFYRLITLNKTSDHSVDVEASVKWTEGSQTKSLTVKESLYNWK